MALGKWFEWAAPRATDPVDDEKDVIMKDGQIQFIHWESASSSWLVDVYVDKDGFHQGTTEWKTVAEYGASGDVVFASDAWANDAANPVKYRRVGGELQVVGTALPVSGKTQTAAVLDLKDQVTSDDKQYFLTRIEDAAHIAQDCSAILNADQKAETLTSILGSVTKMMFATALSTKRTLV